MNAFVRSLGLGLLLLILASKLGAGENSWSYTPFAASNQVPYPLVFTGDPDIFYSSSFRYLLRSDDGGRHWSHIEALPGTSNLKVDPGNPDLLFRSYYEYVMRSSNGGKSWAPVLYVTPYDSVDVLISRHFPGRVYVVSKQEIWQSRDGGATFSLRSALPEPEVGNHGVLTEAADGGLYLRRYYSCSRHCTRTWRIDRSLDQGATWVNLFSGPDGLNPIVQAVPHPTLPEVVYFLREAISSLHLFYSEDRGASVVDRGLMPGYGYVSTDETRPDTLVQSGGLALHRSANRGVSWQELTLPGTGLTEGTVVAGPAGRLAFYRLRVGNTLPAGPQSYLSNDAGSTWSALEVDSFSLSEGKSATFAGPDHVLYAQSQSKLYRSTDDGNTWQGLSGPLVYGPLVGDPASDTVYFVGSDQSSLQIWRSRDGGQTYTGLGYFGSMEAMVALRKNETTSLIATLRSGDLARSPDGGDTWVVGPPFIVGNPTNVHLETLAVSGESVYARAAATGGIYGSEDAGATWSYRGIEGDLLAAGGGLLAVLDRETNTMRVSTTGGAPLTSYPLPIPAFANLYNRSMLVGDSHGALYLLASSMVLRSRDQGRTWQSLTQGLPELTSDPQLLVHPADGDRLYWGEDPGFYRGTFADEGILALLRGRFEARLRWRTSAQAEWKSGTAAITSDQSGVFHLFTPERAEVAVQMLDGRSQGGRFWVFVASMTDVEIELEILDRVEGEVWRHHQAQGEIRSVADLSAFPRLPDPSRGALPLPFGGLFDSQPVVGLDNLFDVSVSWVANGEINVAKGRRLLGDTAAFTFFDDSAVDVVINIIDGRPLNGKYWVFGGSLTDVQFVVTIKNRETGVTKTFHNPPGTFAGFSDLSAF